MSGPDRRTHRGRLAVEMTEEERLASECFGERLRRLRTEQKWTHQDLADRVHVTKQYIGQLESGKQQRVLSEVLYRLSRAFGVTMEDLLRGNQSVPEASPEDISFFRAFVALPEVDRLRYRQAMRLLLGREL